MIRVILFAVVLAVLLSACASPDHDAAYWGRLAQVIGGK